MRQKEYQAPEDVFAHVASKRLRSVYLFYDSEPLFVEEFVRILKRKLLVPGLEVFDFEKIDAHEVRGDIVGTIEAAARQLPVAAPRRLVVVEHLEELRKEALEKVCGVFVSLPDSVTVVAGCEYEKGLKEVFKKTGVERFVVQLRAPEGDGLVRLLKSWGEAAGLKFDDGAAQCLVEVCGSDLRFLKGEMDKLETVLAAGETVTEDVVKRYVSSTRVFELQEFIRMVRERNAGEALRLLRRLEEKGEEPLRIVVNLGYALLNWLRRPDYYPKEMPWGEGTVRTRRLYKAIDALYEINRRIVSGHPEPFALLDMWLVWALGAGRGREAVKGRSSYE